MWEGRVTGNQSAAPQAKIESPKIGRRVVTRVDAQALFKETSPTFVERQAELRMRFAKFEKTS